MKLSILREELLRPLQLMMGIVERRQTLPILANVLLRVDEGLSITATDLEVELSIHLTLNQPATPGVVTVPTRKLVDICRSLPEHSLLEFTTEKDRLLVQSGKSRFSLTILPAEEYPGLDQTENLLKFPIEQKNLRFLLHRTHFAMALQDVRYYLNGMLLEINQGLVRSVATDGHRLALNTVEADMTNDAFFQVIIPRKGVTELLRLLNDSSEALTVTIMTNHIQVSNPLFKFTSKLIDGRFPNYERVLPKGGDKMISLPREVLKQSLTRASILSNEKLRGIQLQLRTGLLRIIANNAEREEAEEEINVDYQLNDLDIGFNVKYLTDILETIDDETVTLTLSGPNNSVLVEGEKGDGTSLFVVMPMRL
jgi:DNA polymerase-3 subunit beta